MPFKDEITHIHPSAVVIFVPGFGDEYSREDVVVANTVNEEKDISSIQLMRTVRNQPGTFSITLMDNRDKFIIPDNPHEEIPKLHEASQRRVAEKVYQPDDITNTRPDGSTYTQPAAGSFKASEAKLKDILVAIVAGWNRLPDTVTLQMQSDPPYTYSVMLKGRLQAHTMTMGQTYNNGSPNYTVAIKGAEEMQEDCDSIVEEHEGENTPPDVMISLKALSLLCEDYIKEYYKSYKPVYDKSLLSRQSAGTDPEQFKDDPPISNAFRPPGKFFENVRGNHYEFETYEQWASFSQYILIDPVTGKNYPTQFLRGQKGVVEERWAFLDDGSIVFVAKTAAEESTFVNAFPSFPADIEVLQSRSVASFSFPVLEYGSEKADTKDFDVKRVANAYLQEVYKDEQEQGSEGFNKGKCKIKPMDRVVIFMPPRFLDDGTFNQEPQGYLIRAFTGVVNTVQQGYSNGVHQITVQGEDVTKYMRISIINVNPALELSNIYKIADQDSHERINIWGNVLLGLTTPEIVRLVTLGSDFVKKKGTALNQKIDGIGWYKFAEGDSRPEDIVLNAHDNTIMRKSASGFVGKYDFKSMLGQLFEKNSVHIIDPYREGNTSLRGFRPYELNVQNNWSFYQADFKTRRDIAYKSAEDSHFNFYADRYGHIWFHPNRFDMSWIISAKIPEVYIIDEKSIISYGFVEDDSNIFTSVYVTTEPDFGKESLSEYGFYHGSFKDEGAMLRYGQRIFVSANPIINTKLPEPLSASKVTEARSLIGNSIKAYAKSLLQRILAEKYQGQITITGRPEIDPGRPIYVPMRNMIYYLETVDTSLDFGQSFQTTLHLSYGRKPWEYLPELITFSSDDEIYLTDAYVTPRE